MTLVTSGKRSRSGAVLITTLGMLAIMGFVVSAFLELVFKQTRYRSLINQQERLRVIAYSAQETTLAVLNEFVLVDGGLFQASQGWGSDVLGNASSLEWPEGVEISVKVEDESGKLPLQEGSYQTLLLLLGEIGFDLDEGAIAIDSLFDWIDEDDEERLNGAESRFYKRRSPSYLPSNQTLKRFEELRYIRGFDELFFGDEGRANESYRKFKAAVSLRHTDSVNIHSAPDYLIEAIGKSENKDFMLIRRQTLGRDREAGTEDDVWLRDASVIGSELLGVQASLLRITITVSRGERSFLLTALVKPDPGASGDYPFEFIELYENSVLD